MSENLWCRGIRMGLKATAGPWAETHSVVASEQVSRPPPDCELKLTVWGIRMVLKAPVRLSAETHGTGASEWVSRPLTDHQLETHSAGSSERVSRSLPDHQMKLTMLWHQNGSQGPCWTVSWNSRCGGIRAGLEASRHTISWNSWCRGIRTSLKAPATLWAETHSAMGSEWLSRPLPHRQLKLMVQGHQNGSQCPCYTMSWNSVQGDQNGSQGPCHTMGWNS